MFILSLKSGWFSDSLVDFRTKIPEVEYRGCIFAPIWWLGVNFQFFSKFFAFPHVLACEEYHCSATWIRTDFRRFDHGSFFSCPKSIECFIGPEALEMGPVYEVSGSKSRARWASRKQRKICLWSGFVWNCVGLPTRTRILHTWKKRLGTALALHGSFCGHPMFSQLFERAEGTFDVPFVTRNGQSKFPFSHVPFFWRDSSFALTEKILICYARRVGTTWYNSYEFFGSRNCRDITIVSGEIFPIMRAVLSMRRCMILATYHSMGGSR